MYYTRQEKSILYNSTAFIERKMHRKHTIRTQHNTELINTTTAVTCFHNLCQVLSCTMV